MFRSSLIAAAFLIAATGLTTAAPAQDLGYDFGIGLSFSQGYARVYSGVNHRRVPYFALHPPVYYGQKVARPYGYSPFAVPPAMVPAESRAIPQQVEFQEVENPFFRSEPAPVPTPEPISEQSIRQRRPAPRRSGKVDKST